MTQPNAVCENPHDSLAWTIALRLEGAGLHCPVNRTDIKLHRLDSFFPDLIIYQGSAGKTRFVAIGKIWKNSSVSLAGLKHDIADYLTAAGNYQTSLFLFVEKNLFEKMTALAKKIVPAPAVFWFKRAANLHWELDPNLLAAVG